MLPIVAVHKGTILIEPKSNSVTYIQIFLLIISHVHNKIAVSFIYFIFIINNKSFIMYLIGYVNHISFILNISQKYLKYLNQISYTSILSNVSYIYLNYSCLISPVSHVSFWHRLILQHSHGCL